MPNYQLFKKYKERIEIDYFTYFTKCYFALNAYLKAKFDGNDRAKIDSLKDDITAKNRFLELVSTNLFNETLIKLNKTLCEAKIENDGGLVSFEKVKIYAFQNKTLQLVVKNSIQYSLWIIAGKDEKIKFQCKSITKNNNLCSLIECKYIELEQKLNESKLSTTQRQIIKSSFDQEIMNYNQNLTTKINSTNRTDADKELIYKGFIEIIYLLRNALFHSQIDPSNEQIYEVYKLSYQLFKDFLYKLPED